MPSPSLKNSEATVILGLKCLSMKDRYWLFRQTSSLKVSVTSRIVGSSPAAISAVTITPFVVGLIFI